MAMPDNVDGDFASKLAQWRSWGDVPEVKIRLSPSTRSLFSDLYASRQHHVQKLAHLALIIGYNPKSYPFLFETLLPPFFFFFNWAIYASLVTLYHYSSSYQSSAHRMVGLKCEVRHGDTLRICNSISFINTNYELITNWKRVANVGYNNDRPDIAMQCILISPTRDFFAKPEGARF